MPEAPFAYSLVHNESGWTWSVLDEDGETVASGQDPSQSCAQAAIEAEIRRVSELLA